VSNGLFFTRKTKAMFIISTRSTKLDSTVPSLTSGAVQVHPSHVGGIWPYLVGNDLSKCYTWNVTKHIIISY